MAARTSWVPRRIISRYWLWPSGSQRSNSAGSRDAILSLPPVGLGSRDAQVGQVFKDCFREICLNRQPVRQVLDEQAGRLSALLAAAKVPCWSPDPAAPVCAVA